MNRRPLLALPLILTIAACDIDPVTDYMGGFGDPVRGAALFAPRNLGDTSRWQGDPAGAAMAAAQLEFLARSFRDNPIYNVNNVATSQTLQSAVAEMRSYLGIAPGARNADVEILLRRASVALREGSQAQALAALTGPNFTAPPAEVLRRLGDMPRLPIVSAAAGMAANAISPGRRS
ncbi:hypothetical protein KTR66_03780 [Roseococcus sp. SDR]|uniref:hypothetical protein n=1 Tax=Roseococcus sp. SDR TaxID=2835532 RepID=UPI001BCAF74C|nr:hypothetical protein [Roseococcus sp. SDR]MBS7789099.1 hypothetical protein [Roseococcus sp. SDR]MBV1844413.1 hypothetical protein [Roseococcus sp. SDR]